MSEVAKAVKPLFDKFIDFFDIFDLSFFVSGVTFVAAVAWAGMTPRLGELLGIGTGAGLDAGDIPPLGVIVLIFASYISGMTCFAVGRFTRTKLRKGWATLRNHPSRLITFEELARHGVLVRHEDISPRQTTTWWTLTAYGEHLPWLRRYVHGEDEQARSQAEQARNESALYVRMWAELRQREGLSPSFVLLRRYWVSAATLDGLFIAALTWVLVLGVEGEWLPALVTLVGACFALYEAGRYDRYQREELVATVLQSYDLHAASKPSETGPQVEALGAASERPEPAPQADQPSAPAEPAASNTPGET
ncbi:hypothetical protein G6O69_02075 [Pseudenhygromyxa sp. WMMC2535]|uniref:hypothetical protein n=1 Tax=Pseudenhygromyxa sp. WMMC2535 TaxID=2712867 RepID=UPI0015533C78|nr:hypothetical protein [Pseudenhygromyxa sp. WMMC2535]NVB36602.1 hypothetical protein [Pseudenhygromyxa sp. WMMC2535]